MPIGKTFHCANDDVTGVVCASASLLSLSQPVFLGGRRGALLPASHIASSYAQPYAAVISLMVDLVIQERSASFQRSGASLGVPRLAGSKC
jgi:hypothetical protein